MSGVALTWHNKVVVSQIISTFAQNPVRDGSLWNYTTGQIPLSAVMGRVDLKFVIYLLYNQYLDSKMAFSRGFKSGFIDIHLPTNLRYLAKLWHFWYSIKIRSLAHLLINPAYNLITYCISLLRMGGGDFMVFYIT